MKTANSRKTARSNQPTFARLARRLGLAFVLVVVGGLHSTSCSFQPFKASPSAPTLPIGQQAQSERFKACLQFFA